MSYKRVIKIFPWRLNLLLKVLVYTVVSIKKEFRFHSNYSDIKNAYLLFCGKNDIK
jgi:hypothetical protein